VSPALAVPIAINFGLDKLVYFMIPGFLTAGIMYAAGVHRIDDFDNGHTGTDGLPIDKVKPASVFWVTVLVVISAVRAWIRISLATFGINLFITKSINPTVFAYVLSFQLLFSSLGTLAGGYLSDMHGNRKVLIVSMVFTTLFLGLTVQTSGILALIAFVLTGTLNSSPNSANIVMARDFLPNNSTFATGLIMGLGAGLGGIGTLYHGYMADAAGIVPSFLFLLIPLTASCILSLMLPRNLYNNA
jgi:FSR family fosmidomycin resistance protein-like MFS transporter